MDDYKNTMKKEEEGLEGACWEGYEAVGFKEKNGKRVPNCVPKDSSKGMAMKKIDIHDNERVVIKSADGIEYVVTKDGLHRPEETPTANVLKSTRTKRGAEDYIRFRKLKNAKVVDTTTLKGYGAYMGMPEYDMGYHIIEEEMDEPVSSVVDDMESADDFGDIVTAMCDAGYAEMGEFGVTLTDKWYESVGKFVQDALSEAAMKSSDFCCDKKDLVMLSYKMTQSLPENADFGYQRPEPQAVSDSEVSRAEQNGSSGAVDTDSMPAESISESEVRTSTYKSDGAPENTDTGHERRPEESISDEEVSSAAHGGASGSTDTSDPNMSGEEISDGEVDTATHLANHNKGDSGVTHDEMDVSKGKVKTEHYDREEEQEEAEVVIEKESEGEEKKTEKGYDSEEDTMKGDAAVEAAEFEAANAAAPSTSSGYETESVEKGSPDYYSDDPYGDEEAEPDEEEEARAREAEYDMLAEQGEPDFERSVEKGSPDYYSDDPYGDEEAEPDEDEEARAREAEYDMLAEQGEPDFERSVNVVNKTFKSLWEAKAWSNPDPEKFEVVPTSFWDKKEFGRNKAYIVKERGPAKEKVGAHGNRLV